MLRPRKWRRALFEQRMVEKVSRDSKDLSQLQGKDPVAGGLGRVKGKEYKLGSLRCHLEIKEARKASKAEPGWLTMSDDQLGPKS